LERGAGTWENRVWPRLGKLLAARGRDRNSWGATLQVYPTTRYPWSWFGTLGRGTILKCPRSIKTCIHCFKPFAIGGGRYRHWNEGAGDIAAEISCAGTAGCAACVVLAGCASTELPRRGRRRLSCALSWLWFTRCQAQRAIVLMRCVHSLTHMARSRAGCKRVATAPALHHGSGCHLHLERDAPRAALAAPVMVHQRINMSAACIQSPCCGCLQCMVEMHIGNGTISKPLGTIYNNVHWWTWRCMAQGVKPCWSRWL